MCGISGVIDDRLSTDEGRKALGKMMGALQRRGPDGSGIEPILGGFIGHTRLALVDPTAGGHQPVVGKNGGVLAFNGEIYNFRELRRTFTEPFKTTSDVEVLQRLIERDGFTSALCQCEGMFAVAYFCPTEKVLLLARDRVGEKPLYYSFLNGTLVFASDLKAIVSSGLRKCEISKAAFAEYMANGFISAPTSIYENVFKLGPGQLLKFHFENGRVYEGELKQWFDLERTFLHVSEPKIPTFDKIVELAHEKLRKSVALQASADAKLGSFLSGGIDSSVVTAIMAKCLGSLETFTLGSKDARYNESRIAESFANHLGVNSNVVFIEDVDMLAHFEFLAEAFSEPLADSSQIPTSIISYIAAGQVKGVLTGDGGDELFGGYYRYGPGLKAWNLIQQLRPRFLVSGVLQAADTLLPQHSLNWLAKLGLANARDKVTKLRNLKHAETLGQYYEFLVSNSLTKENLVSNDLALKLHQSVNENERCHFMCPAAQLAYWDQTRYMPGDNLAKIDRVTMFHSLEARAPMLNSELVGLMNSVPYGIKAKHGQKSVLKEIQKVYYPSALIGQPKKGFSIPLDQLIRCGLRDWSYEWLFYDSGFFDHSAIMGLWTRHLRGENCAPDLWRVISFNRWFKFHHQGR